MEIYSKNICEIFGHEYIRDEDNNIKYDSKGGSFAQYTDSWYEDEGELISPAIPSTNYGICKYCGQEFEEESQFPYDYEDTRNISMIRLSKKKKNK